MPNLREVLTNLFNTVLDESKEKTEDIIMKFLDCEMKVVFTKDPSFIINAHSWPEDHIKK